MGINLYSRLFYLMVGIMIFLPLRTLAESSNQTLPQGLDRVISLSNLSLAYQNQGKFPEAQDAITQSLALLPQTGGTLLEQQVRAQSLDILGQLQLSLSQTEEALTTWQEAEKLYQSVKPDRVPSNRIYQAVALQKLGFYPRACRLLLSTLAKTSNQENCAVSVQSLQAWLSQPQPHTSRAFHSLGDILRVLGQYDRAVVALKGSWQLATTTRERQEISLSLGNTYKAWVAQESIGLQETGRFNNDVFLQRFRQARENLQSTAQTNLPLLRYRALLSELDLLYGSQSWLEAIARQAESEANPAEAQRSRAEAKQFLQESQTILKQLQQITLPQTPEADLALISFARHSRQIATFQGQLLPRSPIVEQLDQLLQGLGCSSNGMQKSCQEKETNPLVNASAWGERGALYEKLKQWNKAASFTEYALQVANANRSPEIIYQYAWQLGRINRERATQARQNGDSNAEKQFFAQGLSSYQSAFRSLQQLRADLVTTAPEVQYSFRQEIEPVYRELAFFLLEDSKNKSVQVTGEKLREAQEVLESLQIAELNNFFRDACVEAKPIEIEEIDPKAAIVYTIVFPDRVSTILNLPSKSGRFFT